MVKILKNVVNVLDITLGVLVDLSYILGNVALVFIVSYGYVVGNVGHIVQAKLDFFYVFVIPALPYVMVSNQNLDDAVSFSDQLLTSVDIVLALGFNVLVTFVVDVMVVFLVGHVSVIRYLISKNDYVLRDILAGIV